MANRIVVNETRISTNRIDYLYTVEGEWISAFNTSEPFFIEYGCDISDVPESVAVVPLLANLLPMAWVYDAEIVAPVCDKDFFDSIEDFKKGYIDMFPMMELKGKLTVNALQQNRSAEQSGSVAFFSGGVDAFNTLINHAEEKPVLLIVWGIDVYFDDIAGWKKVEENIKKAADTFKTSFVPIKSCLRRYLNRSELDKKIAHTGDFWWHGFQHSIGAFSHAAPVVYALKKSTVYFASTYTIADKGKLTCASDPTIDNYVRFCGAHVVHDGYEFTRQMKVRNIVEYSERTNRKIHLHVCWKAGGANCCLCEKCWRTLLAIYAEKRDPNDYGLEHDDKKLRTLSKKMRYGVNKKFGEIFYDSTQETMRKNCRRKDLPKSIRWFYSADVTKFNKDTLPKKLRRKARLMLQVVRGKKKPTKTKE